MRHDLNRPRRLLGLRLVVLHGLIFAAAGPAIGAFLSPGVIVLPIGILFSYLTSAPVALLAGLLTGAAALRISDQAQLMVIATCTGAVCGMLVPAFALLASRYDAGAAGGLLTLYAIDGGFAAAVCARMTLFLRRT